MKKIKKKTYYLAAALVFALIAIGHGLRVAYGWEAVVADMVVPMWFSWAAVIIAGYLAVRGYQFAQKTK